MLPPRKSGTIRQRSGGTDERGQHHTRLRICSVVIAADPLRPTKFAARETAYEQADFSRTIVRCVVTMPDERTSLPLLTELSTRIESAQQDFQRVADEVFNRLEAIDPDLVGALAGLFERRQAAAHYLATVQFDDRPNVYATLAAGKRSRVLEAVIRMKHGIF